MLDLKSPMNKAWITYGLEGHSLFEYSSVDNLYRNIGAKEIRLNATPYYGTGHVVYDEHFYYHWADTNKIVRFDLNSAQVTTVRIIPDLVYKRNKALKNYGYLYQSQSMFVHFNVDQNGLWIVYAGENENITVAMLNPENLDIIKSVNVNVGSGSKGGALLSCGKMYTLKHHDREVSYFDEEHDLWLGHANKTMRLGFKNPFKDTSMISYDPNTNKIMSWDKGKLLLSPLLLENL
ncbi:hypothetical protein BsWGS_04271 [Bradybaena similaris]